MLSIYKAEEEAAIQIAAISVQVTDQKNVLGNDLIKKEVLITQTRQMIAKDQWKCDMCTCRGSILLYIFYLHTYIDTESNPVTYEISSSLFICTSFHKKLAVQVKKQII